MPYHCIVQGNGGSLGICHCDSGIRFQTEDECSLHFFCVNGAEDMLHLTGRGYFCVSMIFA